VLRKTFVLKREKLTEDFKKIHIEGPHDLYYLPNMHVMKSRMMRWAAHNMTNLEEKRNFI
jgi:hypothetical protein